MNDKTFIDAYRTPHTKKMHVVERFRMVDGGKAMQVESRSTIRTPSTRPGRSQRYHRVSNPSWSGFAPKTTSICSTITFRLPRRWISARST